VFKVILQEDGGCTSLVHYILDSFVVKIV